MSDIFEKDIDTESEDLSSLEDNYESDSEETKSFVFPSNLYKVKLVYSFEGIYVTPPEGKKLNAGESVIVPTRYGLDLALVMGESKVPVGIKPSDVVQIERVATEDDLEKAEKYKQTEKDAFNTFREKVSQHHLDMKLVAVHFLVGEPKALFFFSSDNRVDFRELVKDLVSIFKMRIELRQIGVRDESRITGGLGVCGRPYCCNCVSDKLRPVSIRMAKDQNLSLNSMKISGQCGRLLCCLSYEYDWYAEARKKLPNEGIKLFYDGTNFRVSEVNLITSMVKMMGEDGRFLEVNASRFVKDGNRWKIN
ncbi:MAG: regulatory iron-sulfur-containing complex subunit RicT [Treponema sp.]|nr:regulatory iron-sulfur-containing complex subunit RicT [Treponema sp.]